MSNLNILPNQEVPIELRKKVYKKALKIIKNWEIEKNKYTITEPSLCYFLLMVLYNSKKVLHEHPKTYDNLVFSRTNNMFPELNHFLTNGYSANYTNKQRIKFLKSVI